MSQDIASKAAALAQPHNLMFVDEVLKLKPSQEQVQVTLGWHTPQDTLIPSVTLVMSASFAKKLGEALTKAAKG
jgi:hypothetical protein